MTRELGKIDVVAKGARKGGSRLAGSSDPLAVATMSLAEGKKNLFVTQSQPISSFRGLRTDYDRLTYALAFVELAAALVPYEQPLPEAFDLIMYGLAAIEAHTKPLVALVWAELRLMELSGFMPQLDECVVTGASMNEASPHLSPRAGGFVAASAVSPFTDRFRTTAEVVFGIRKMVELEEPPANLKFAEDTLSALLPFWRHIADTPLPANEACVAEVRFSARTIQP